MAEWKKNVEENNMAGLNKKRKRDEEAAALDMTGSESQQAEGAPFKRGKTVSFDDGSELFIEPAAMRTRPSIEPPFDFPPPAIAESQTTRSSLSEVFSISPDADHEVRSQAPQPESPTKQDTPYRTETTVDFLKRYPFVLDIPTTDGQRVAWIRFLEKYNWSHSLISSLRRFFMADTTRKAAQTAKLLEKLKAVCASIEEVDLDSDGEKRYTLCWDSNVVVHVEQAAVQSVETPRSRRTAQPTWIESSRVGRTSGKGNRMPTLHQSLKMPSPSNLIKSPVSPTESQVNEAAAAEEVQSAMKENIQSAMKEYVKGLKKGAKVEPPCDRCREFSLDCRINKTSCKNCAQSHNRCQWSKGQEEEGEGERNSTLMANEGKEKKRKKNPTLGQRLWKGEDKGARRKSIYNVPNDDDDTAASLEDDGDEFVGASERKGNGKIRNPPRTVSKPYSSSDEEEDEWVPSS